MAKYIVIKIKSNNATEVMGEYQGKSPNDAIQQMALKGDVSGREFSQSYIAIPPSYFWKRYKINVK